jgi:hypothetical protein
MLFQWWKRVVFENKRIYINNTAVQDGLVHIGNKIDFSQKKRNNFLKNHSKINHYLQSNTKEIIRIVTYNPT